MGIRVAGMISIVAVSMVTWSLLVVSVTAKDCILSDLCSCNFDDGIGKIDLTSLGKTDNTPPFKDVLQPVENQFYSYSPCGGFTEGSCQGAASCLTGSLQIQTQIGDATSAKFRYDDESGHVIVMYTSGSGVLSSSEVSLVCNQSAVSPVFTPQGEDPNRRGQYEMTLTTVCACPEMCNANGPINGSGSSRTALSVGSILIIILTSSLLMYCVFGMLFMRVVRKARGAEVIPCSSMWLAFPGLVKDGISCVFSKLGSKKGYDNV